MAQTDGVQDQIHRLVDPGFVGHDAVVKEVPDHGQVQHTLPNLNVGDVRHPLAVGHVRMEFSVEQILVFVYLLPHLLPFPASADLGEQIIFLHDPQHGFGVMENVLAFQPQPHPPVSIGTKTALPLLRDHFRKCRIFLLLARRWTKVFSMRSRWIS